MSENICYSVVLFTCWLFFGAEGKDYAAFDNVLSGKSLVLVEPRAG